MCSNLHPESSKAGIQTLIFLMPESLFMYKTGCDKIEGDKCKGGKERYNYLKIFLRKISHEKVANNDS